MHVSPHIAELVRFFQSSEDENHRGPRFKELALALEEEMKASVVLHATLLHCLGPPDFFDDHEVYVYFFDHDQPGRNGDEWYFHFERGKLVSSGYNRRGVNDVSRMRDRSQFVARDE